MLRTCFFAGLGFVAGFYGFVSWQDWRAYQRMERQRVIDNAWWNKPAPQYS